MCQAVAGRSRHRDPQACQCVLRTGRVRPPAQLVRGLIDPHRAAHVVEPIVTLRQGAPSAIDATPRGVAIHNAFYL